MDPEGTGIVSLILVRGHQPALAVVHRPARGLHAHAHGGFAIGVEDRAGENATARECNVGFEPLTADESKQRAGPRQARVPAAELASQESWLGGLERPAARG